MSRGVARHLTVLGVLGGLTLAYTWPLAMHVRSHYVVRGTGPNALSVDQLFCSWVLASDVHRLVHDPFHVFETNNLHPFRHTLAYSENMLGVALLVFPVQLLWDDPTLTHNVAALVAMLLTAFGVFLLVYELGRSTLAAVVAAVLAIYSPALWSEVILLPLIVGQWTPFALLLLVRLFRTRDRRLIPLLGLAIAAEVWSSLQHGIFLILALAATVPALAALGRSAWRALPHATAAGVLAALLCVPIMLPYRAVRTELDSEARLGGSEFSLRLQRVVPPLSHPVAYFADRFRNGERLQSVRTLTPWLLIAAGVVALGFRRGRQSIDLAAVAALTAGGFANLLFALGPLGDPRLPSLYPFLTSVVPGLAWFRVPMRAILYTALVLGVLGGVGLAAVLHALPSRAVRVAVATGALVLVIVEAGWRPVDVAPAPDRTIATAAELRALGDDCAIADLPASYETDGIALFRSTKHWRPLVNGYSGYYPLSQFLVFGILNGFPGPDALAYLQEAGSCAVLVRDTPDAAYFARVVAASEAAGLSVVRRGREALIRVPPAPPEPDAPVVPRTRWTVAADGDPTAALALDGDLETAWIGATRPDYGPDRLTVDLGAPTTVTGVAVELGRQFRSYLRSYRIEGSAYGAAWTTLAEQPVAIPPLRSYRADYRRIRQRIDFPAAAVRWLRIGPYRKPPPRGVAADVGWNAWRVAELAVYGRP